MNTDDPSLLRDMSSALFTDGPDMLLVFLLESMAIELVNERFLQSTGCSRGEVVGRRPRDIGFAVGPQRWEEIEKGLRETGTYESSDVPFAFPGGARRYLSVAANTFVSGGETHVVALLRDETDSVRAREEVLRSRLLLENSEQMARIGSWQFDFASGRVSGSPGAHAIYGILPGEFTVEAIESIPLPEYRSLLDRARDDLIERGIPYDLEFRVRRRTDGVIADVHSRATWNPEKRTLFGTIRDITEEKLAREVLESANEELERRVDERSRLLEEARRAQSRAETVAQMNSLVAFLAHEMNTPIGVAMTAASFLAANCPDVPQYAELKSAAEVVERSVSRAARLVAEFARLGFASATGAVTRTEFPDFLDLMVRTVSMRGLDRVTLVGEPDPQRWSIDLDTSALAEVFTELTQNAMIHNSDGVNIRVRAMHTGAGLELTVTDDGRGIDATVMPHIFEPFTTTARVVGRPGLGLSIVHGLVTERLHGTIVASNAASGGAVFIVNIPDPGSSAFPGPAA